MIGEILDVLQPIPAEGETIEGRFIRANAGRQIVRRFYRTANHLRADAARLRETHHCYFGVALRRGHTGTAMAATRSGTAWADIDAKLFVDEPDPKGAAYRVIDAFGLRPSVMVDSGGGYQPYWLFPDPVNLQDPGQRSRLEAINAALPRAICGPARSPDHVHDVARIMRLDGTWNLKPEYGEPRPVVVTWSEPDRRYSLEQVEDHIRERHPWALRPQVTATASSNPSWTALRSTDGLFERATRGRIRRSTLALLDSVGPAGYQSASEADAALAAGLISAGLTEDEVYMLISTSVRGRNAVERKGPRHVDDYLRRTASHAAAYVGPVIRHDDGIRVRRLPAIRRQPGVSVAAIAEGTR